MCYFELRTYEACGCIDRHYTFCDNIASLSLKQLGFCFSRQNDFCIRQGKQYTDKGTVELQGLCWNCLDIKMRFDQRKKKIGEEYWVEKERIRNYPWPKDDAGFQEKRYTLAINGQVWKRRLEALDRKMKRQIANAGRECELYIRETRDVVGGAVGENPDAHKIECLNMYCPAFRYTGECME